MLDIESGEVSYVMVSVDFLEGAILVPEVASDTVRAKFFPIELPAVLRFVLVVDSLFLL